MTNVLVRDLTEETHRELLRRAEERGQSLQQYLAAELTRLAVSPTLADVLRRIETRSAGRVGLDPGAADLGGERPRRGPCRPPPAGTTATCGAGGAGREPPAVCRGRARAA